MAEGWVADGNDRGYPCTAYRGTSFTRNSAYLGPYMYRGTSLIRKRPPRVTLGPEAQAYCRVLRELLMYRVYSKSRTHTALGPNSRATPRSIGPS